MGDAVFVGAGSVVEAVAVGSNVYIGQSCVIGKRTIIKDCCWIMDGTVLSEGKVILNLQGFHGCIVNWIKRYRGCAIFDCWRMSW